MQLKWQGPQSLKTAAIFLALVCHALFSSPAPANPGLAEAVIGLCLLLAAAPQFPQMLDGEALLGDPRRIAWLYLLFVPLGIGLYAGHLLRDLSRDLIAVGFLGLPILIGVIPQRQIKNFAAVLAGAGSVLALRYWIITGAGLHALQKLHNGDGLLYLCLDSTMLFAAIYLPVSFMEMKRWNIQSLLLRLLCLLGAFLCWGTLGGMEMRGALGLAFVAISIYACLKIRQPLVPLVMIAIALAISVLFWSDVSKVLMRLWQKQQQVGLNARDEDFAVIWKIISVDPMLFLFGSGWGAVYSSPAVGGYWVNYSHSALGYFLFKTGLVGVCMMGVYLLSLLRGMGEKWRNYQAILIAIVPPLLLSFTIYTSYKFLSCGLLLLLLQNLNAHSDPEPG